MALRSLKAPTVSWSSCNGISVHTSQPRRRCLHSRVACEGTRTPPRAHSQDGHGPSFWPNSTRARYEACRAYRAHCVVALRTLPVRTEAVADDQHVFERAPARRMFDGNQDLAKAGVQVKTKLAGGNERNANASLQGTTRPPRGKKRQQQCSTVAQEGDRVVAHSLAARRLSYISRSPCGM